jgi:hypothetical protein
VLKIAKYSFYQCAAKLKNTTFFSNIKVPFFPANYISQTQPLYLRTIHSLKCHYRKQLISKTATMLDVGLHQDVAQIKLDVLPAMHLAAEPWRLVTSSTIKNCFVKCSFSSDHVSSNDDSAVKLTGSEEDDWHSSQPLGVQFED